jgi:MEMO1 family protein
MSIVAAMVVPHPPIILPEIGQGEEKKIQKTIDAYRTVMERAAALQPDTVVLTSPHSVMYADYFHVSPHGRAAGDFGQFHAADVRVEAEYDTDFVTGLEELCRQDGLPAGTMGESEPQLDHGTMVPLRFLNAFMTRYGLVRIGLSGLSPLVHYELGQHIAQMAEKLGRRVVFIASGDLSHKLAKEGPYGFAPEGPMFDQQVMEHLEKGDFLSLLQMDAGLCEAAAECGLRSFWIMAGALDRRKVKITRLSYEGPFGVGYGVVWLEPGAVDEMRDFGEQLAGAQRAYMAERRAGEDELVQLARLSIETYVKNGQQPEIPGDLTTRLLNEKAGAFVSLKKDGRLRGCIGTILPVQSCLAEEIVKNAISAATADPRFSPVQKDELDALLYSVDVLAAPELVASAALLDVKRYGVIVECGSRRGLLLPDLAGVDTVEQQISIARQKGGINPDEEVRLWRFEVVRHI